LNKEKNMALMDLPQAKWGGGTGRQVILKSDFAKIEEALVESFQVKGNLSLRYAGPHQVEVNATGDCKARVMLCGFPSPVHRGLWVDGGGLTDGRYRVNAAPETLDWEVSGHLWGREKSNQWYCVYALAGPTETLFSLKAMPVMRVSSQTAQTITLRNNANSADIGYGFRTDELANARILMLTGASRGVVRPITANNSDNGTGGTISYGGSPLTVATGDWFVVLPNTNFRYLGMVFNDEASNLVPFLQEGNSFSYLTPRTLASGALNGFTPIDLGLVAPPTAKILQGYAAAQGGAEVKLAISHDGTAPALIVHGAPPSGTFRGVQGALPFSCQIPNGHVVYLDNGNSPHQRVNIWGWTE
jgi:hypothetical protein